MVRDKAKSNSPVNKRSGIDAQMRHGRQPMDPLADKPPGPTH